MKYFAYVLFGVVIISSPVTAAVEQCRFIQAKPEREACYERQEKALAARRKPAVVDNVKPGTTDELKIENDRLGKSLRSICRGC